MSTPYQKGAEHERQLREKLESWFGMHSIRSAGSHGAVDIIAGNGLQVFAIQVKDEDKVSTVDLNVLREWAQAFNAVPIIAVRRRGGKWSLIPIDGDSIFET